MDIQNVEKILREEFSIQELTSFVAEISRYNRIQGSEELELAANYIYTTLRREGIDAKLHRYDYNRPYGYICPIVGWDVRYAEVRMVRPEEKLLHSYITSRTVVVAHSPPGKVEGEVIFVGKGAKELGNVEGKIVLTYESPRRIYWKAQEGGAVGIVFYSFRGPENAVPYQGLFFTPEEAKNAKIPAVNISRRNAYEIIRKLEKGDKVVLRIVVESSYRLNATIPVVEATIGDTTSEIHLFAHICHPGGTINDNVSGSATLLELALALNRAISKGRIEKPDKHRIVFLWFPEYTGSAAYLLSRHNVENIVFGINFDMIGELQEKTNSTLLIVRSPKMYRHPYEALIVSLVLKHFSASSSFGGLTGIVTKRIDIVPYDDGSDHDVYLFQGIPSIMFNQWPDEFYHTDMDTIDKFDPIIASRLAVAVGTAVYMLAKGLIDSSTLEAIAQVYEQYVDYYQKLKQFTLKGERTAKTDQVRDNVRYEFVGFRTPISRRYIEHVLPKHEFEEIEEFLNRKGYNLLTLRYIPLLLLKNPMTLVEIYNQIVEEYGVEIPFEDLKKMLEILKKIGAIKET